MDEEGRWVESGEELKGMSIEFYSNLFRFLAVLSAKFLSRCFPSMGQEKETL